MYNDESVARGGVSGALVQNAGNAYSHLRSKSLIPAYVSPILSGTYSVPLFEKEGLGEILLNKSPSAPSLCSPPFSKGEVNTYLKWV